MKQKIEFSLYVNGMNTINNQLFAKLLKQCDEQFGNNYALNLYDLKKDGSIADKENVLVTPTLVRDFPLPSIRVTGDLSNINKTLLALKVLPIKKQKA